MGQLFSKLPVNNLLVIGHHVCNNNCNHISPGDMPITEAPPIILPNKDMSEFRKKIKDEISNKVNDRLNVVLEGEHIKIEIGKVVEHRLRWEELELIKKLKYQQGTLKKIEELQDNIAQSRNLCCLCSENPIDTALIPCGHVNFCYGCAELYINKSQAKSCPICREKITKIQKIYL